MIRRRLALVLFVSAALCLVGARGHDFSTADTSTRVTLDRVGVVLLLGALATLPRVD